MRQLGVREDTIYVKTHSEVSESHETRQDRWCQCAVLGSEAGPTPSFVWTSGMCFSLSLSSAIGALLPHSVLVKCTPGQKNPAVSSGVQLAPGTRANCWGFACCLCALTAGTGSVELLLHSGSAGFCVSAPPPLPVPFQGRIGDADDWREGGKL